MPDSDDLKPNEPGGTKYSPPTAVRLGETQRGRSALSLQLPRFGCNYDVRRSRGDQKNPLRLH